MAFTCPHCGEEIQLLHTPQKKTTIHCTKCGQAFSINDSPASPSRAAEPPAPGNAVKDLAQQYFADLPDAVEQESPAQASEALGGSETGWSPKDGISEADTHVQREMLFKYAHEMASRDSEEEPYPQEKAARPARTKSFIREKRWQRGVYFVLLLCAFILPLTRILLSRGTASVEQFNWMQPQMIPSLLYFLAVVVLLFPLLRCTSKASPVAAGLLFIPMIADFWYLIPQITDTLAPELLQSASSALKILIAAAALIMSKKPMRHPALPYREVNSVHEPAQ